MKKTGNLTLLDFWLMVFCLVLCRTPIGMFLISLLLLVNIGKIVSGIISFIIKIVEKKKHENIGERIPYLIVPILSSLVFLWNGITQIIGISENPQSIFSFLSILWGIGMIFWMLHWVFDIAKIEAKVFNTLYCLLASLYFLFPQIFIMLFSHY